MINIKKLDGGGDKEVEALMDEAALLGVDLIELMWTPRGGKPRFSTAEVCGFEVPIGSGGERVSIDNVKSSWIEGRAKFYPDKNGRCWGYVFDTEKNRELLMGALVDGWYRVVDNKLRAEIEKSASEKGYETEPAKISEVLIKKSKREREAEEHVKNLEKKLAEAQAKEKQWIKELSDAQGKKEAYTDKRLKGVKLDRSKFEDKTESGK